MGRLTGLFTYVCSSGVCLSVCLFGCLVVCSSMTGTGGVAVIYDRSGRSAVQLQQVVCLGYLCLFVCLFVCLSIVLFVCSFVCLFVSPQRRERVV